MTFLSLPMSALRRKRRIVSTRMTVVVLGILAFGPIAHADDHAEESDAYLIASWGVYNNMNTAPISELLAKEFPGHSTFVGRVCTRYCKTPQYWSPGDGQEGSTIGFGYSLSEEFAVEISWMYGPSVSSTVVQASNPVWHLAKHKVTGVRVYAAYEHPLSPRVSLEFKAGLLNYTSRLTYSSYTGDGGADNLQGSGSTSQDDAAASFSAGLAFGVNDRVETSLQLNVHQDSGFSFNQSTQLQLKLRL